VQESENFFFSFRFMPRCRTLPNQETVNAYVENGLGVALAWRRDAPASVELFREALLYVFQNQEM
jgi:DNA-binding transcriptional LysR family regulator